MGSIKPEQYYLCHVIIYYVLIQNGYLQYWTDMVLYCIEVFIWRPSTAIGKQRHFWYHQLQEKRQVLRSDKDVGRLDDRREARAEGGRRFQREGAITAKDLDMAMVVLVQGTKSSCLSMERRGRSNAYIHAYLLTYMLT